MSAIGGVDRLLGLVAPGGAPTTWRAGDGAAPSGRPGPDAGPQNRARGIDPRPVAPRALPASASVSRTFPRHTLDGAAVRAALLDLVVTLALQLRGRGAIRVATTLLRAS
ncbi:hypothetical protein ACFY1B_46810 [Streptomyces mirabilis]|uniref:hypothetical protein n=1 Tax=Streptomyces mirabilis TaxID=68239 RepID=UPI00367A0E69